MITMVKDSKGADIVSFSFREICDKKDLITLRDTLMESLEICISFQEAKDASKPFHLYLLSCMIKELNKDIEEQKGDNV